MAKVLGTILMITGVIFGAPLDLLVGRLLLGYDERQQAKKARQRARDAYNASLQDRLEMVDITPDAPRTLVLGRVRTVEGVRRRWVSGTNSEKLTMVVSFAGHEIDGFEEFYFNDTPLEIDGDGWVTTAPFYKEGRTSLQYIFTPTTATQTVTLDRAPISGTVQASWTNGVSGDGIQFYSAAVVGISGANVTLSGLDVGASVSVNYEAMDGTSTARIRTWLGAFGQNVGADIAADYPDQITASDRFAGMAVAVVDVNFDPDIYPQGRPNVTARLRGAKLYDPRLDSTAGGSGAHRLADPSTWQWSENSALCALRYAQWGSGYGLPAADIRMSDIAGAAAVCDVGTVFTLRKSDGSTSTVTLPRYSCGIVIKSDSDPRASMDEIIETMAGRLGWAGGVLRLRAGTVAAPVFTLQPGWLAQRLGNDGRPQPEPVVRMSNGITRDQKVNRVSGRCIDPDQRYQVLPFPAVQDAVLIAAEGEYPIEVEYQGVNHIAHAQHLASVAIRESQAALRMDLTCNLYAYRCELFDVGTIVLPRYGMTEGLAKQAEVVGWRWHPTDGVGLQLAEIAADIYTPLAELVGRDPAPNSALPAPGEVEQLTIAGVASGTSILTDGSVITRTKVSWGAAVNQALRVGGQIEVQYAFAGDAMPAGDWPSWIEGGSATSATISGLRAGWWVFRVRGLKPSWGVRGPWSAHVVAQVVAARNRRVYRQPTAPTDAQDGDQWIDTAHNNAPYLREGGAWVTVRDGDIAAAAGAASAAAGAAATALGLLTDIASDSLLTPDEKPRVIQDVSVITTEQAGIDAQATNYAVATEKTVYDAAVTALNSYLGGLTSPTSWNNLTGNTDIVGATFRAKFADVYVARQAVLDKIAANAKARLGALATLNTVGTGQIDAGSATGIYSASASGITVDGQTGTPTGDFTTLVTYTFTPAVDCEVLIGAEGYATITTPASGFNGDYAVLSTRLRANSTQLGPLRTNAIDFRVGFSQIVGAAINRQQRFAATGGVSYTITLEAQKLSPLVGTLVNTVALRVEEIKR